MYLDSAINIQRESTLEHKKSLSPLSFPGLFGKQLSKPLPTPFTRQGFLTVQQLFPDFSLQDQISVYFILESRKDVSRQPTFRYPLSTTPPEHGYCHHHHPRDSWLPQVPDWRSPWLPPVPQPLPSMGMEWLTVNPRWIRTSPIP